MSISEQILAMLGNNQQKKANQPNTNNFTRNQIMAQQLGNLANQRNASPLSSLMAGFYQGRVARDANTIAQQQQAQEQQNRQVLIDALSQGGLNPDVADTMSTQDLQAAVMSQRARQNQVVDPVKLGAGDSLVNPQTGEIVARAPQQTKAQTEVAKLRQDLNAGLITQDEFNSGVKSLRTDSKKQKKR